MHYSTPTYPDNFPSDEQDQEADALMPQESQSCYESRFVPVMLLLGTALMGSMAIYAFTESEGRAGAAFSGFTACGLALSYLYRKVHQVRPRNSAEDQDPNNPAQPLLPLRPNLN